MQDNANNTQAPAKARKSRTVSTSFLEKVREREGLSVSDFLSNILTFQSENSCDSFQTLLTQFGNTKKTVSSGASATKDPNRAIITEMFAKNMTPIAGGEISRIGKSRKHPNNPKMYAVSLKYPTGSSTTFHVDMTRIDAVLISINDAPIGTGINCTDLVPTNSTSQSVTTVVENSETVTEPSNGGLDI